MSPDAVTAMGEMAWRCSTAAMHRLPAGLAQRIEAEGRTLDRRAVGGSLAGLRRLRPWRPSPDRAASGGSRRLWGEALERLAAFARDGFRLDGPRRSPVRTFAGSRCADLPGS